MAIEKLDFISEWRILCAITENIPLDDIYLDYAKKKNWLNNKSLSNNGMQTFEAHQRVLINQLFLTLEFIENQGTGSFNPSFDVLEILEETNLISWQLSSHGELLLNTFKQHETIPYCIPRCIIADNIMSISEMEFLTECKYDTYEFYKTLNEKFIAFLDNFKDKNGDIDPELFPMMAEMRFIVLSVTDKGQKQKESMLRFLAKKMNESFTSEVK